MYMNCGWSYWLESYRAFGLVPGAFKFAWMLPEHFLICFVGFCTFVFDALVCFCNSDVVLRLPDCQSGCEYDSHYFCNLVFPFWDAITCCLLNSAFMLLTVSAESFVSWCLNTCSIYICSRAQLWLEHFLSFFGMGIVTHSSYCVCFNFLKSPFCECLLYFSFSFLVSSDCKLPPLALCFASFRIYCHMTIIDVFSCLSKVLEM